LEGAKSERLSHLRDKEVIDELFHKTANLLSEKKADIKNKEEQAQQLRKDIAQKTDHAEDIKKTKMALEATIQEINNQYKTLTDQYNQYSQELETAMNKYFSSESSLKEVIRQAQDEEGHLTSKILEHKFVDIEEVKRYVLDNEEIENTEREINQYKEKLSKVIGAIEKTESKLNGRNISEENWLQLQTERMDKEIFLDDLKKETTLIEQEVKNMESKFLAYKELQAKVNDIDYRLGILKDLDSLFKGNKFVEFVALERLKYVSREASERLLDITGDQYGLETDGDGRFLIQDNKNGGVLREASTLSGGETFLTSLALALALSAEIQLKGTAPLELFFLDEGFGTLDDHLLDVVMSSLEKIHHDKLKVGIISHVESVKNRVPVKLIVQETITGESGSKVRIELN
jgi:DNA repair protein SbcC/Rad50